MCKKKMKMITKAFAGICLIIGLFMLIFIKSPEMNLSQTLSPHDSIYNDPNRKQLIVTSMQHTFDINFVCNSSPESINPYFPTIHIETSGKHNAWLHLVKVEGTNVPAQWKSFIDAGDELYPFYTFEQSFYDCPHWNYYFYSKLFQHWKSWIGHAYAIQMDRDKKIITCIGGISWGFKLSFWHWRPIMILPTSLTQENWQQDWEIFEKALPEYTIMNEQKLKIS